MMTEPNPAADAPRPKRFLCRHILTSGRRCRSAALRGEQFCYYHHTTRRPALPAGKFRHLDAAEPFPLPIVEDRASALLVASQILCRIASNDLDPTRAGRLLYGLQVIACFLPSEPRPLSAPRDSSSSSEDNAPDLIEDLILDSDLGPIAPIAELRPPEPPQPRLSLLDRMMQEFGPIVPIPQPAQSEAVIPQTEAVIPTGAADGRIVRRAAGVPGERSLLAGVGAGVPGERSLLARVAVEGPPHSSLLIAQSPQPIAEPQPPSNLEP